MSMDIAIVQPVDWLAKNEVGFELICETEEDSFLSRDELETRVLAWIADNPDEGLAAAQELQEWFDDLSFNDVGVLHIHIYP